MVLGMHDRATVVEGLVELFFRYSLCHNQCAICPSWQEIDSFLSKQLPKSTLSNVLEAVDLVVSEDVFVVLILYQDQSGAFDDVRSSVGMLFESMTRSEGRVKVHETLGDLMQVHMIGLVISLDLLDDVLFFWSLRNKTRYSRHDFFHLLVVHLHLVEDLLLCLELCLEL